ncbi:hypothetical protein AMS68_001060 [Peltaster fructicola]|uniref:Sodium/calcium exchanger membrane region domain-containing protein n=1 Tax=Peltaster fructicola TaxID=286661 RepID=A0A6H0XLF1_9PEZI|nr:hypothetical protein AMS68_001060 [Peltaster fructicola]
MGETSYNLSDNIRSALRKHPYSSTNEPTSGANQGTLLPITEPRASSNPGSLKHSDGRISPTGQPNFNKEAGSHVSNGNLHSTGEPSPHANIAWATSDEAGENGIANTSSAAAPPNKSQTEGSGDTTIENGETTIAKPTYPQRAIAGSKRFVQHVKNTLCSSYINILLIFVPIGIAAEAAHLSPTIIFALNAIAIVPLASILATATEAVALQLGSNIGALLNVTFGNAVELIIFIIALAKGEISIVQASIIGSILSNLLLILGMAFLLGGLRFREQVYNNTVTQMSACLLTLSVGSLVLPTAFHASFNQENSSDANTRILEVSRGTSVILLLVYVLYLLFQLKSHAYLYESTPQHVIDEESHPGVLADMLNSSSSSSGSDSDTCSTDSSGSHGTAGKRLRRLIRNTRRRKSSASTSTAGTVSMPSISSPSVEHRDNYFDNRSQQTSRPASPLGVIVSGDEADADAEDNRATAPRIRDFVSLDSEALRSSSGRKKHRRRHKYKHRKHRHRDEEKAELGKEVELVKPSSPPFQQSVEDVETEHSVPRRPFNMRGLSSRATTLRPGLTKMLSNNVFVTPQPTTSNPNPITRLRSEGAIRRTNSLPDRLNKQNQPAEEVHLAVNGTLPPYKVRRVPTPHVRIVAGENEVDEEKLELSRTAAVVMLIVSTALVAVCAEFMVDAIPEMLTNSPVSEAFIGLIILPIVGNAAEHVTAVTVAAKNKMDLAIAVAVGSSIQIALFVTPLVVLLGWIMHAEMSLYFNIFQTVSLFIAVLVVNFLCLDGRSNYLEGALLIAAYVIIALVAFYYPQTDAQSALGGGYTA